MLLVLAVVPSFGAENVKLDKNEKLDKIVKEPAQTVITSDSVEMNVKEDSNVFTFHDNVHLVGAEMDATCKQLEVRCPKNSDSTSKALNNIEAIEKIIADGDVTIKQPNRTIKAGHAIILPQEGKVILEDHPEIIEGEGVVKGYRIVFYKNDQKAHVESGPAGERPSITLPNLAMNKLPSNKES